MIARRSHLVLAVAGSAFAGYRFPSEIIALVVRCICRTGSRHATSKNSGPITPPPGPGLAYELEGDQLTFVVPARPLRRG